MNRYELINYNKKETRIFIPNEIFLDLQSQIEIPSHIAFAYSYYYLITYLYRYNKYLLEKFPQSILKEFLGVNPSYKKIDYIIKKGGILDTIGYTKTTSDYPVSCKLNIDSMPVFQTISEWKQENPELADDISSERNYKIKYPVKAFFRNEQSLKNDIYDGTFYEASHTHSIHVNTFVDALEGGSKTRQIGYMGFYLYGYLNSRIGRYGAGWLSISLNELENLTKMSHSTLNSYLSLLELNGFLYIDHMKYKNNPNKQANVYRLKRR